MKRKDIPGRFLTLFVYFVVAAFLLPRGPIEYYGLYKSVSAYLVWASVAMIWTYAVASYKRKLLHIKSGMSVALYFIAIVLITLVLRVVLSGETEINGLQKMFAYPSIFVFAILMIRRNAKLLLKAIASISTLLLAVNLVANVTFFSGGYHITFLGHVQMASQFCILAIFSSLLLCILDNKYRKQAFLTVLLSVITLIITDATSAHFSAAAVVVMLFLAFSRRDKILTINPKKIFYLWVIANAMLFIYTAFFAGKSLPDFSGRTYVWTSAFEAIRESPLFGYGIEGVLLSVFWTLQSGSDGFNYAHNQFLQNMLDGGIVCFMLFLVFIYNVIKNINVAKNKNTKMLFNGTMLLLYLVMLFESVSIYCYAFMIFGIIYAFCAHKEGETYALRSEKAVVRSANEPM